MPVLNKIQFRRGIAASWNNEILSSGEVGLESDTGKFKIGDGITAWNSLGYSSVLPSELNELVQDIIGTNLVAGSGISVSYNDTSGNTTVSLSNPNITSNNITDFNSAVSGLLPVKNVSAGSGILVTSSNGNYTVSLNDPTIQVSDITDLTVSAVELNYLDGSIPGSGVAGAAIVLDSNKDIQGIRNLTLQGDLTVNGTTTTVNSTTITVDDKNLELGSVDSPTDTTADGGGITLKGADDIELKWLNSNQSWNSSEHFNVNGAFLTYKINGTTVLGDNKIGASGYALASGVIIDGGTP